MDDNFSSRVKDVISYSKEEALRLGHKQIGTEHLLLGMLRDGGGKAISILNSIEINLDELRKKVELLNPAIIDSTSIGLNEKKNLHLTRQAERALKTTFLEAKLYHWLGSWIKPKDKRYNTQGKWTKLKKKGTQLTKLQAISGKKKKKNTG